jgi:hypothetical protein
VRVLVVLAACLLSTPALAQATSNLRAVERVCVTYAVATGEGPTSDHRDRMFYPVGTTRLPAHVQEEVETKLTWAGLPFMWLVPQCLQGGNHHLLILATTGFMEVGESLVVAVTLRVAVPGKVSVGGVVVEHPVIWQEEVLLDEKDMRYFGVATGLSKVLAAFTDDRAWARETFVLPDSAGGVTGPLAPLGSASPVTPAPTWFKDERRQ